jgi:hypothetical protein
VTPYATVEEADVYFLTRLNTEDWDDASETEKLQALNMATRAINNLRFKGTKSVSTQENAWPRIIDSEFSERSWYHYYNVDAIPSWLKEATCEIAINLLDGTDMEQEAENLIAVNQAYAGVSTGYNPQLVSEHMRAGIPSIIAWNLLQPHLIDIRKIKLSRG